VGIFVLLKHFFIFLSYARINHMKRFEIITIFPKIFDSYFGESILKRAQKNENIDIKVHNLRQYSNDKHHNVDDTPYGGGAGMVMQIEPIYQCVQFIKSQFPISNFQTISNDQISNDKEYLKTKNESASWRTKTRIILFSAKGKRYTQADALRLSKYDQLILICGRYEGVDERVAQNLIDEEISIGDFVLTGGEIPAMILVDSITRLLPEVLGNPDSLKEESFSKFENCELEIENSFLEYPQYTKPEEFNGWKVPSVLLSGNHKEIENWRQKKSNKKWEK
jgi:tRNA (guanine37-N1)-methyltransferase